MKALRRQRREAERFLWIEPCSFETSELIGEGVVVHSQGKALILNAGAGGLLLVMDQAPGIGQIIEIRANHPHAGLILALLEVRWTQPVPVEGFAAHNYVGSRFLFGPFSIVEGRLKQKLIIE